MKLILKNFSVKTIYRKYEFENRELQAIAEHATPVKITVYQYKTEENIFSIEVRENDQQKTYKKDIGFDDRRSEYHNAIENHFKI